MEIKLTEKESETYFHNALCNGADYLNGYGISLDYDKDDYLKAKKSLEDIIKEKNYPHWMTTTSSGDLLVGICCEDVWMQILKNGDKLTFVDEEGDGDQTNSITISDVHARVQLTPLIHLQNMIDENDDADTADVILQTVIWEEVIFG